MTIIYIDVNKASNDWIRDSIGLISKSRHIKVLFSEHPKVFEEVKSVHALLRLMYTLRDTKRRIDIDRHQLARHIGILEGMPDWDACSACDDPHIFSSVYLSNGMVYIVTNDLRQLKCRKRMRGKISNKYLNFKLLTKDGDLLKLDRNKKL